MSNETNETIADIINEKRTTAREIRSGTPNQYGRELAVMLEAEADRIEAAYKRADDQWHAAFAKIEAVVTLQYAKRNLGDKGRMAVAEIMSACRFPDGALDEFRLTFAENARLSAALKPVLECKVMSAMTAEIEPGKSEYCAAIIEKAQSIYNEGEENSQPDRGARRNAETTEATDPTHSAVRKG